MRHFLPFSAKARAIWTVLVVFPTPPFWLPIAMMRVLRSMTMILPRYVLKV
jgi:hypothetical protein